MKKLSKIWLLGALVSLLAACGSQDKPSKRDDSQETPVEEKKVPEEILAKVPKYVIERTNQETGVVEYAYTNEEPAKIDDLSTEEARLAYGKSEAERWARATPVEVKTLQGDEDMEMMRSSESFFFGGFGLGGCGLGFGGLGFGLGGFGFGYCGLGFGGFGGFGFRGFGLGGCFW